MLKYMSQPEPVNFGYVVGKQRSTLHGDLHRVVGMMHTKGVLLTRFI